MIKNLILLAIISSIMLSCRSTKPTEIYGKWRLKETLSDPGDGSGRYQPAGNDHIFLIFKKSGRISGTALPDAVRYNRIDSAKIQVSFKTGRQLINYHYILSQDFLTLIPPCIESCGLRFERVNKH